MEDSNQSAGTNPVGSVGPQVRKAIAQLEAARDNVPPASQDALEDLMEVMSRCSEARDEAELAFVTRLLKVTTPLMDIINEQDDADIAEALRLAAIEVITELLRENSIANTQLEDLLKRLQRASFKAA